MESGAGDGYGNRSSGGTAAGKRKNARQLAFDTVADVMKTHSTVVAESVDRASKCQCDVLQRQCDIMEREARTQEKQCEVLVTRVRDRWSQRGFASAPWWIAVQMEVDVALRGWVLGRSVIFYEMQHRRGLDYSRDFRFENGVSRHEVRHYEIDVDGDTCLHLMVGFEFGRILLRQLVVFARKVGTAIPNRWAGGVDVLSDIIDLFISYVATGYAGRLHEPALYVVHAEPPFFDRDYLHGEVRIKSDDFH
ncbi:hypothetical protein CBR_g45176 [Chara braunii]|uniref:Uncharacterized protein n=1 Tax=Chara braunii TaxID=69332 RepID=A0A388K358_CHABU|nr:hypothetical protein CBR_g45176 [Chara braunii]|eukprot:GBG64480.1 hypothetical protein CBR_g45176 [Chara braunii]